MIKKRIKRTMILLLLMTVLFGGFCYFFTEWYSSPFMSYNVYTLPSTSTGIVLGTSRKLSSGIENLYFSHRITAAEKLFKTKKVKKLILSGDNRVDNYNEPKEMRKALMKRGVPDSCLILDYAGLRTFDSMIRCKQIFGQDTIIVVSQEFHNARAIFIARKTGLLAYGYNADKVTTQKSYKVQIREFFFQDQMCFGPLHFKYQTKTSW